MFPSSCASSDDGLVDRDEILQAQAEGDRRGHTRLPADELTWINKVRLKYGPTLSLVDLSSGGVQIEIEDYWLRPGSTVVVEIMAGATTLTVPSRVLRCHVAEIAPSIKYRGALEFKRLLELPDPSTRTMNGRDANPLHSHARLALALRRLESPVPGDPGIVDPQVAPGDRLTPLGAGAMAAALAMVDTAAGRRAGAPFVRELSGLFGEVAQGIEQRESPQALTARLEQRLRRVIPARSIQVTDGSTAEPPLPGSDVVYFGAHAANGQRASRILVEFARDATPEEWQFQLLKTSGHLVALINELVERERPEQEAANIPEADDVQTEWNKLVVRFADGRLLKGYCRDFLPPRGHFRLSPSPVDGGGILVPIGHLKAVFFVRDFDGNPDYQEDKTAERPGYGRRAAVTFLDDERLVGMTLNYRMDAAGFFVTPCDPKSNNVRIFVGSRAVRHVEFL